MAANEQPFKAALLGHDMPLGCIVATCELVSVKRMESPLGEGWEWSGPHGTHYQFFIDDFERALGQYSTGRYAWLLHNVKVLPMPVAARGALGLWEWSDA